MISHEYKCIYIHIPKTAGTSIENLLGHHRVHEGWDMQDHRTVKNLKPLACYGVKTRISSLSELITKYTWALKKHANPLNKLTVNSVQYNSYFKFTFVRNPWARVWSYFSAIKRDPMYQVNASDFDSWLTDNLKNLYSLKPHTFYLEDYDGNITLDFVGKYENLYEDFTFVTNKLGLENCLLPHMGKGDGSNYRDYYSDTSKKLVADFYKKDIELFGYEF